MIGQRYHAEGAEAGLKPSAFQIVRLPPDGAMLNPDLQADVDLE